MRLLTTLALSLAIGVTAAGQPHPTLAISVTQINNLVAGQNNASFVIHVSNVGSLQTSGAVQVTASTGSSYFQINSVSGPGWNCTGAICTRSDALATGASYPALLAVGSVTTSANGSVAYAATVYFGGDPSAPHQASKVVPVLAAAYPVAWGGNHSGESSVPPTMNNVVALAGGGWDTLALRSNGTVTGWGSNAYGQRNVPAGLTNVISIAAGDMHSLALKSNGTVVAWGDNSHGEATVPAGLTNVVAIAAGHAHSLALKSDGTVVGWGLNTYGQATPPAGLKNVVALSAGWQHSVALLSNGTVAAWGYNGDGETTVPSGLSNVTAIAAGAYHTLALTSEGEVQAWGADGYGQIEVPDMTQVVAIAAGWDHSLALQASGTIVGWGYGGYGQLIEPSGLSDITSIGAGGYHSLAITATALSTVPVTVKATSTAIPSSGPPTVWVDTVPYSGNGVLFYWSTADTHEITAATQQAGTDVRTQFYFNSWNDGGLPDHMVQVTGRTTFVASYTTQYLLHIYPTTGGTTIPASGNYYWYNAGFIASVTETPDAGATFTGWTGACTGTGPCNITMKGPNHVQAVFQSVSGVKPSLTLTVSHSSQFLPGQAYAVYLLRVFNSTNTGPTTAQVTVHQTLPTGLTLVSIGGNNWNCSAQSFCTYNGANIGTGQMAPAIVLIAKVASTATSGAGLVAALSGGGGSVHNPGADTLTIVPAGYPLAWGSNSKNQANLTSSTSNVLAMAGGVAHTLALRADGSVQAWGDNSHGQSVATSIKTAVAIAAGANHNLALLTNGTVVAWGDNSFGQTSVPSGLLNVVGIAAGGNHSMALISDGSVVGWGSNGYGESNVPNALKRTVGIAAGDWHSLAVTVDGAVLAWGLNTSGQTSVPVIAGGATAVAAGANHSLALSSTGVVSAWGDNSLNQIDVPSGLPQIARITASGNHSLALSVTGTASAWGDNDLGESTVPGGVTGVTAIGAGADHSMIVEKGAPTVVAASFSMSPLAAYIAVDGRNMTGPAVQYWASGSSHTITAPSPQAATAGTQYVFSSWSDGGAASHTVSPTTATAYAATFQTQYQLTTAANDPAMGTVSPATGWYNAGAWVQIIPTAKAGYQFLTWSGACNGAGTCYPQMTGPLSVTANFGPLPSLLSIQSTHSGNFYRGQTNAQYTLTVKNGSSAGPTSGAVRVTEYLPSGLTLASMSGTGWTCYTNYSYCSRSDALAPGGTYPAIKVFVNVSLSAPSAVYNNVSVSGGNSPTATASDYTIINAAP